MSIRVGEIVYTNILPLNYYMNKEKLIKYGVNFTTQIPATLNRAMKNGEIDLGGFSSFAYAENADKYHILPDLSVASYGKVGSIFLFSKIPIHELNEKKIALTSSSATSVALLKIILQKFYQFHIEYDVMPPNYDKMMEEHDACLLIGDDAILTVWNLPNDLYQYDLGELWYEHTGYPMTYALYAVRNEIVEHDSDVLTMIYEELIHSKKQSIDDHFLPMIHTIQLKMGGSNAFWESYFAGLHYDLDEKQQEGLRYYYHLAFELGLLPRLAPLKIWNRIEHCHYM